jgi:hypothetical protein
VTPTEEKLANSSKDVDTGLVDAAMIRKLGSMMKHCNKRRPIRLLLFESLSKEGFSDTKSTFRKLIKRGIQ